MRMFDELTERELQVLDLFAHGYNAEDIQKKLGISDYTVHTYLARIYEKTNDLVGTCKRNSSRHSKKVCVILLYLKHIGVLNKDWEIRI